MTEYWKSNPMHWCDVCKCWLQDTKMARLNHERGIGHKENLAKKLREMAKKADADKAAADSAKSTMDSIEQAARRKFEADQKEAERVTGRWTWDAASGYYYNELYRWYYDATTGWYYGGEPVAWTQQPATLPAAARWENAPREGGPAAAKEEAAPSTSKAAAAAVAPQPVAAGAAGAAVASTAGRPAPAAAPLQRAVPAHPMQNIGGYQAPLQGRIGGAKGVGNKAPAAGGAPGSSAGSGAASDKRKREDLPPEEAEALARREAARQRVQQRTMASFGFS